MSMQGEGVEPLRAEIEDLRASRARGQGRALRAGGRIHGRASATCRLFREVRHTLTRCHGAAAIVAARAGADGELTPPLGAAERRAWAAK
jgi:hypothetical protein